MALAVADQKGLVRRVSVLVGGGVCQEGVRGCVSVYAVCFLKAVLFIDDVFIRAEPFAVLGS